MLCKLKDIEEVVEVEIEVEVKKKIQETLTLKSDHVEKMKKNMFFLVENS